MGIIQELPPSLVNQIAAGEVVERPASVLKELIENSLDAGATRVSVAVETSEEGLVQVRDNGCGILRDDLPRAFLRHATSKITSFEDLASARTLGFRGEALAAISSVSRVTVETRHAFESVGSRMSLVPGEDPSITDWSGPVGTTVTIRDLFFNVPVRRKFLKSSQTEMGHLIESVTRLALSFHECQFDMSSPTRKILSLEPRPSHYLRLLDLYPSFSEEDLVSHEIRGEERRVSVYLLRPDKLRKDRHYQHLFINRRWVRHPGLFEAITQGMGGKLSRDVYVGAWVYLEIDPEKLDVNVHPTKREVRLLDGDRLFSLVRRAVDESFSLFDAQVIGPQSSDSFAPQLAAEPSSSFTPSHRASEIVSGPAATGEQWGPAPDFPRKEQSPPPSVRGPLPSYEKDRSTNLHRLPEILKGLPPVDRFSEPGKATVLGQIAGTYLVIVLGQDLALVDWHTAHERINYEKFRHQVSSEGVSTIALLFPAVYRVPPHVADSLDNRLDELRRIGFDMDRTGPEVFRIRSVPFLLEGEDPIDSLNGLRETSEDFDLPILRSDRIDEALMTLSCHQSVRRNDQLNVMDGERILRELLATPHPYTCPHGRPTMIRFPKEAIDQWFGR